MHAQWLERPSDLGPDRTIRDLFPHTVDFFSEKEIIWLDPGTAPLHGDMLHRMLAPIAENGPRLYRTPLEWLGNDPFFEGIEPPSGFIFHLSRCGSTLLARALAGLDSHLVISETQCLNDSMHAWRNRIFDGAEASYFRNLLTAFAPPGPATGRKYFFKFSSWNTAFLEQILDVFPTVPWLFLYRDPHEVMVSILDKPTGFLNNRSLSGSVYFNGDMSQDEIDTMSDGAYTAALLTSFCRRALARRSARGLFVNYRQITVENMPALLRFFGYEVTDLNTTNIPEKFQHYSKDSQQKAYVPDTAKKQKRITPEIRDWVQGDLADLYHRLETDPRHFTPGLRPRASDRDT